MRVPELEPVGTVGELLDLIETQAETTRKVSIYVSERDGRNLHSGSLPAVIAAQVSGLTHNLAALRTALAEHDALSHPLGEILETLAGNGKVASYVLDDTATRIVRVLEESTDPEPDEEEEDGNDD